MIHLRQMRKLMTDHVVNDGIRENNEPPGKPDRPVAFTASQLVLASESLTADGIRPNASALLTTAPRKRRAACAASHPRRCPRIAAGLASRAADKQRILLPAAFNEYGPLCAEHESGHAASVEKAPAAATGCKRGHVLPGFLRGKMLTYPAGVFDEKRFDVRKRHSERAFDDKSFFGVSFAASVRRASRMRV